jgi:hypothetical protein
LSLSLSLTGNTFTSVIFITIPYLNFMLLLVNVNDIGANINIGLFIRFIQGFIFFCRGSPAR